MKFQALSNSAATNKVKIDPIKVDKLVNLIMHEADLDNNGYLEVSPFNSSFIPIIFLTEQPLFSLI